MDYKIFDKQCEKHQKQHRLLEEPLFDSNFTTCLYRIMLESGKRYKTLEILSREIFLYWQKSLFFLFYTLILKITKQTGLLGHAVFVHKSKLLITQQICFIRFLGLKFACGLNTSGLFFQNLMHKYGSTVKNS